MKKVIFALFAVVIAIGGSAFTNAKLDDPLKIYGNSSLEYTKRTTTDYNPTSCAPTSPKICAYQVTEQGRLVVVDASYTDQEMIDFKIAGDVVELPGSSSGVYTAL